MVSVSLPLFAAVKVIAFVAAVPTLVEAKNGVAVSAVTSFAAKEVPAAALEGAAESIPKPNAATATSAMRLKVVFVDICFLSISRSWAFPTLGFGSKMPSHMSGARDLVLGRQNEVITELCFKKLFRKLSKTFKKLFSNQQP
jgi:hypothetical protein